VVGPADLRLHRAVCQQPPRCLRSLVWECSLGGGAGGGSPTLTPRQAARPDPATTGPAAHSRPLLRLGFRRRNRAWLDAGDGRALVPVPVPVPALVPAPVPVPVPAEPGPVGRTRQDQTSKAPGFLVRVLPVRALPVRGGRAPWRTDLRSLIPRSLIPRSLIPGSPVTGGPVTGRASLGRECRVRGCRDQARSGPRLLGTTATARRASHRPGRYRRQPTSTLPVSTLPARCRLVRFRLASSATGSSIPGRFSRARVVRLPTVSSSRTILSPIAALARPDRVTAGRSRAAGSPPGGRGVRSTGAITSPDRTLPHWPGKMRGTAEGRRVTGGEGPGRRARLARTVTGYSPPRRSSRPAA
jgi:hypothetical protein